MDRTTEALVNETLCGDRRSLARLISLVEKDRSVRSQVMRHLYPRAGRAHYVGLTGPPGGGKSTLVAGLTSIARANGAKVGVVAVDPTSPYSGGALLGDRVRMQEHHVDDGVFIRSMATRGDAGGLSQVATDVARIIGASGKDMVMVETVGVGQNEADTSQIVDTTIVVTVPESGDYVQLMKAGLMETADVVVVNKADHAGADQMIAQLASMLCESRTEHAWWRVHVVATQAANGQGVDELYWHVRGHLDALERSGELARRRSQQRMKELGCILEESLLCAVKEAMEEDDGFNPCLEKVAQGELDPYAAAAEVLGSPGLLQRCLQRAGKCRDMGAQSLRED